MIYRRQESEYYRAKLKAARSLHGGWVKPADLPTNAEIREQLHALAQRMEEGGGQEHGELLEAHPQVDRFQLYESLLLPLEHVRQSPHRHPEGDALYHSLQVFDLACEELPYDEEFLVAALLHDVGKAIDRRDHVRATLEALDGQITDRSAWLIEHHEQGHAVLDGSIGVRAHRRLQESENYDELIVLARCDRAGRSVGKATSDVVDAVEYLRELTRMYG